jgi:peptidoglycan/xylan/chitin deacetylase (PgdA/CDA1 family)
MNRFITIGFHDIAEDLRLAQPVAPGHTTFYTIERSRFRQHLDAIETNLSGADVITSRMIAVPAPRIPVMLTFDDGAVSAHRFIADDLEARGWRGHFFITTDWIDTPGFLDTGHIRDLHRRGHVIGSHSCSHPERMSCLTWNDLVREWTDSCRILSDILGERVTTASVPGGYYSRAVAVAAAAAQIDVLFTSEPLSRASVVSGSVVLGRYAVNGRTSPAVSGAIAAGAAGPRFRQSTSWFLRKCVKQVAGPYYLTVRRALLGTTE